VTYSLERVGDQVIVMAQDITEQRLNALRLMHLSCHDPLTGLLNRPQFIKQCEQALLTAGDGVLVLLDIDQFRLINDASGLDAGDSLLAWVAAALREAMGKNDAAARLGGNEFGLLMRDASVAGAQKTAERLQQRLHDFRFAWRESTFSVRSSIGVVPVSERFESASALLGAVEAAAAQAKRRGGNQVFVWQDHEEAADVARRNALAWVARIKDNLTRGHVQLYCQPIVPLASHEDGESFEILFRMIGADGTVRGPQDVVLMAERYGLMDAIDQWVVKNTLRDLARDRKRLERIDHCSINLSATSLKGEALLDVIHTELSASRVPPRKICFEITETAAVDNLAEVRWLMDQLKTIGCRFSLDDFGSGMASYAYLRDLAVDYIKIDRTFVKDMDVDDLSSVIIESIHQIAGLLGARTVAEGVETQAIASALTALGIDYAQGYFFARPGPLSQRG
jgi:diguanylate cyclase (GGDEF)-like protein